MSDSIAAVALPSALSPPTPSTAHLKLFLMILLSCVVTFDNENSYVDLLVALRPRNAQVNNFDCSIVRSARNAF